MGQDKRYRMDLTKVRERRRKKRGRKEYLKKLVWQFFSELISHTIHSRGIKGNPQTE